MQASLLKDELLLAVGAFFGSGRSVLDISLQCALDTVFPGVDVVRCKFQ